MILYPAIDIYEGKAVRLKRGEFHEVTVFDNDPLHAAQRWVEAGAAWLHIVDLEGAKTGQPVHADLIRKIRSTFPQVKIEVGGGIRDRTTVTSYLAAGINRIIFGTSALQDASLLRATLAVYPDQVAVSLDARNGMVAIQGWTSLSKQTVAEAVKNLAGYGVESSRDLSDEQADEGLQGLCAAFPGELIASGGISTLDDLRALAGLEQQRVTGAILGRALYENAFTFADALAAVAAK